MTPFTVLPLLFVLWTLQALCVTRAQSPNKDISALQRKIAADLKRAVNDVDTHEQGVLKAQSSVEGEVSSFLFNGETRLVSASTGAIARGRDITPCNQDKGYADLLEAWRGAETCLQHATDSELGPMEDVRRSIYAEQQSVLQKLPKMTDYQCDKQKLARDKYVKCLESEKKAVVKARAEVANSAGRLRTLVASLNPKQFYELKMSTCTILLGMTKSTSEVESCMKAL